jgi:prepilin-type N-terminal cleavage/methylation domain-containing protein
MNKRRTNGSCGFTLVEVLLAVLLSTIVVLGAYAAVCRAHAVWDRVETPRPLYAVGRQILEMLRFETAALYMASSEQGQPSFLLHCTEDDVELRFRTQNPGSRTSSSTSRPAEVWYVFESDEGGGTAGLYRHQRYCAGDKPVGAECSELLSDRIETFRVEVSDGRKESSNESWVSQYESGDRLPQAVRIRLVLLDPNTQESISLATSFRVLCTGSLQTAGNESQNTGDGQ